MHNKFLICGLKLLILLGFSVFIDQLCCNNMDTAATIQQLSLKIQELEKVIGNLLSVIEKQSVEITDLKAELAIYKNKKNSGNSHIPPSQDAGRPAKNQSLRVKSGKKPGGQFGHSGTTLACSGPADITCDHFAGYCSRCGSDLSGQPAELLEQRQVIDLPVIKALRTAHNIYRKTCSCGHCNDALSATAVGAKITLPAAGPAPVLFPALSAPLDQFPPRRVVRVDHDWLPPPGASRTLLALACAFRH